MKSKTISKEIRELNAIARTELYWHRQDAPTARDVVQILTNVAHNRRLRIEQLERHIHRLCELGKSV